LKNLPYGRHGARGTPIGPFDLQIGATELRHGLVVVTNNVREFGPAILKGG